MENGAEDELTLERNRRVFDEYRFAPYTLADVSARDTSITLFGRKLASPFLVAPTGFNGMLRTGADSMIARAAARAGPRVPARARLPNERLEDIAGASQQLGGDVWFQLYILKTRSITEALLERAIKAGVTVMQVTSDAVVFGGREWDRRNFSGPTSLTWRAKLDAALHPRWFLDVMVPNGPPALRQPARVHLREGRRHRRGGHALHHAPVDQSLTWDDVRWLRERWPGKLLVKGVTRADDVLRARDSGADGVGAQQSRRSPAGRRGLRCGHPARGAPRGRQGLVLLVDGGFRRGTEILKAMALGASAVMVGRPVLYGVAAAGEAGALHALEILKLQTARSLGQLGVQSIAQVTAELLHRP